MADALGELWWEDDRLDSQTNKKDFIKDKPKNRSKKRKLSSTEKGHVTEGEPTEKETVKNQKKNKKRKKPKVDDVPKEFDGSSVTETLWDTFCKSCGSRLTAIELEDIKIDNSCCLIEDSVHCGEASQLQTYLNKVIPYWEKQVEKLNKKKIKGSPLLLVISSAATRAVELNKSLEKFKGQAKVAKLFAKHFKLEEQAKFLTSHTVHIGIGTPNRILKLLQKDSLDTTKLKFVVIDWTWRDQKLRSIADMPEVKDDLNQLLQNYLFPLAKKEKLKIGLF